MSVEGTSEKRPHVERSLGRLVGALRASLLGISAYATAYLFLALVWRADTALFVGLCIGEFGAHYFFPNKPDEERPAGRDS